MGLRQARRPKSLAALRTRTTQTAITRQHQPIKTYPALVAGCGIVALILLRRAPSNFHESSRECRRPPATARAEMCNAEVYEATERWKDPRLERTPEKACCAPCL